MMTTVFLVRHGETTWNRDRLVQGWSPTHLTEHGRREATALADRLAMAFDITRILASDLRRAKETANCLRQTLEVPIQYDRGWRERDFGVYQGLPVETVFDRYPELALPNDMEQARERQLESGETLLEVRDRVVAAWDDLVSKLTDQDEVLVVSHGGPIRILLGHLKGLNVHESIKAGRQANCAINEIRILQDEFEVIRENDIGWQQWDESFSVD